MDIFRKGGGGSRRIQNFLNRKNSDFFGLFCRKGGGSHPIQKGFSRKLGKISKKSHFFWIFCRKLGFFWTFFRKGGGGGLAQSKIFLNRKILGVQIDRGRGGVSLVRTMLKKNSFFRLIASLTAMLCYPAGTFEIFTHPRAIRSQQLLQINTI